MWPRTNCLFRKRKQGWLLKLKWQSTWVWSKLTVPKAVEDNKQCDDSSHSTWGKAVHIFSPVIYSLRYPPMHIKTERETVLLDRSTSGPVGYSKYLVPIVRNAKILYIFEQHTVSKTKPICSLSVAAIILLIPSLLLLDSTSVGYAPQLAPLA